MMEMVLQTELSTGCLWRGLAAGVSILANGGSCIAGPDGEWMVEPVVDEEKLIVAVLDQSNVLKERQNFDSSGHDSRPDVTQLTINRQRQNAIKFVD